jgi:hypothetical protein
MNMFARKCQGKPWLTVRGVMNVYAEKSQSASIDPILPHEAAGQEELNISYTSDSYQKILDYHIAEIFLTTVLFGVIVLFRMHH